MQPISVGMLGGERFLELVVIDNATRFSINEEHAARLQTHLLHDLGRINIKYTYFTGHDDDVIRSDPDAAGAKTIAVKNGTNHRSVGERHVGGAVPRLHQRRVITVKGLFGGGHRGVVFPRLGDHHQHGVMERTPAEMQKFKHVVEAGRV